MSRRPKPVPFTEADLVEGELRRAPRSRRWLTTTVVIVLLILVAALAYSVTYAPDHYAKWQAERISGDAAVDVSAGVQVVPGDGWVAQPLVTNIVEWPPLPPMRDWAVLTGADTGVELLSPDRGLTVELSVTADSESKDSAWLREAARDHTQNSDAKNAGAGESAGAQVKSETLASGAKLTHVDGQQQIRAVVTVGGTKVRVLAQLGNAQAQGSGAKSSDAAESPQIDAYRPALSALLESLTAG